MIDTSQPLFWPSNFVKLFFTAVTSRSISPRMRCCLPGSADASVMRFWYLPSIAVRTAAITSSGFIPHLKVPALGSPRRTALSLLTSAGLAVGAAPSPAPFFFALA